MPAATANSGNSIELSTVRPARAEDRTWDIAYLLIPGIVHTPVGLHARLVYDQAALAELKAPVCEHGVLQPVLVPPAAGRGTGETDPPPPWTPVALMPACRPALAHQGGR